MERYTLPAGPDREVVAASLLAAGGLGVWERDHDLVAWFPTRGAPVPAGGTWSREEDRDWTAEWKAGLEPVTVGGLTVTPSWLAEDDEPVTTGPRPRPLRIVLDPGMAFGTGHHATTRLCMRELQRVGVDGRRVLDVGTGSGVLAIAASLLGAAYVRAVDTDAEAIAIAEANADANGAAVEFAVGTVAPGGGSYDVVVANLVTDTVLDLAEPLLASTASVLITSGISAARAGEVVEAFRRLDAGTSEVSFEGDWAAVTIRSRP